MVWLPTVELASNYFTRKLGLTSYLYERQLPKNGLRFFFDGPELDTPLEEMSEMDREVLVLRHFEQLSNGDVSRLLGIAKVGIDDDFFDLGGHSLIAVRLCANVNKTYGTEILLSSSTASLVDSDFDVQGKGSVDIRGLEAASVFTIRESGVAAG